MNKNSISRRDFLKLLATIPVSMAIEPLTKYVSLPDTSQKHVIVMVYDAWAAKDTSLYGYSRDTTPNLDKFAQKAVVYHRHYSAGNFTVPGVGSLLTGAYPWKHRALALGGQISKEYAQKQMFNVLSDSFSTVGFSQNKFAEILLEQAGSELNFHIPKSSFNINDRPFYDSSVFSHDAYVSYSSFYKNILRKDPGLDGSLFFGPLFRTLIVKNELDNEIKNHGEYDKNLLPENPEQFLLSTLVNGVIQILKNLSSPSLVYLHLYPPHNPSTPTEMFANAFDDSKVTLTEKPKHKLVDSKKGFDSILLKNLQYDRYLASWDSELERLYQFIEESGLREKSYIMITSDHGELFERGEADHMTPLLNQPVVRVPLIISYPGVSERKDIHSTTSSVDILPTIAQLSGKTKPDWVDGQILPGFGGTEDSERSVYCFEAKENSSFGPFIKYSIALSKNNKRLLYYNYDNYKEFEFYDLDTDPEEMNNLYPAQSAGVIAMKQELLQKIDEISKQDKK